MRVSFDLDDVQADSLANIYREAGFWTNDADNIIRTLYPYANIFGIFILEGDTLIGAMRVFSDDVITSYVAEYCVDPYYDGADVSNYLMRALKERFGHTAIFLSLIHI